MSSLKSIINSHYLFWLILAWPAWPLITDIGVGDRYYAELMYDSGVWATQLTVAALAITPAMRLTRGWVVVRWLQKRRRAIGIAAFGYATLHTVFYLREVGSFEIALLELTEVELAVGWVAFLFFCALAFTSNDASVRTLGTKWKKVQRGAYAALALTALHWLLIDQFLSTLFWWVAPLLVLQLVRFLPTPRKPARAK